MGRNPADHGILGVDPGLDGVPAQDDVVLRQRQRLPRRHPQLQLHEVEPGDLLGDRVLDLQPGVHLHEEALSPSPRVARDDELDGARAGVAAGPGGRAGGGAHRRALPGRQQRRRRLLDDLLVPALQRALALAEVDHAAVLVGQHLDLDVPGSRDQALDEQGVVAERAARLAPGRGHGAGEVAGPVHRVHALPAAAGRRLDQHRVADSRGGLCQLVVREPGPSDPGTTGTPAAATVCLARILSPMASIAAAGGPTKTIPACGAGGGERGVLAEEAVAGVDRLRAGRPRRRDHLLDREVARRSRSGPSVPRRGPDVRRACVGSRVHGDRTGSRGPQRADHPHRDLAAVGHEHGGRTLISRVTSGRRRTPARPAARSRRSTGPGPARCGCPPGR